MPFDIEPSNMLFKIGVLLIALGLIGIFLPYIGLQYIIENIIAYIFVKPPPWWILTLTLFIIGLAMIIVGQRIQEARLNKEKNIYRSMGVEAPRKMMCPNCHKQDIFFFGICPNCGARIKDNYND